MYAKRNLSNKLPTLVLHLSCKRVTVSFSTVPGLFRDRPGPLTGYWRRSLIHYTGLHRKTDKCPITNSSISVAREEAVRYAGLGNQP